jgi:sulfatase maturation enzyme AslB (radical SAM superfamily)
VQFSSFAIILTEACNYECGYCYQGRGDHKIQIPSIKEALDFFYPFLSDDSYINFSGGEPLLEFETIRQSVDHINKKFPNGKKINYTLTTNGSLITDEVAAFLNDHRFSVMVSFDGPAQELGRQKGSFDSTVQILKKLLNLDNIELETNSVFTAESVNELSRSIKFIAELGIKRIGFALSTVPSWDDASLKKLEVELSSLREFAVGVYKREGGIPISTFQKPEPGLFYCSAGNDRLALAPDETVWGCYLFAEFFKNRQDTEGYDRYCFGDLDSFIKNHTKVYSQIAGNYALLRMDMFKTPEKYCILCPDLDECGVCPIDAALSTMVLGKLPDWMCDMKKAFRAERKRFWEDVGEGISE